MEIESEYGPAFTMMTVTLAPGEQIKVEPGAMVAQSEGLEMKTGMGSGGGFGGFMKSMMKSAFGGESFFVNTYTEDLLEDGYLWLPLRLAILRHSTWIQDRVSTCKVVHSWPRLSMWIHQRNSRGPNLCSRGKGLSSCVQRLLMSRAEFSSHLTGL